MKGLNDSVMPQEKKALSFDELSKLRDSYLVEIEKIKKQLDILDFLVDCLNERINVFQS